jgi:HD-GYP domain-containing protein (c-di-GMP phosphodiesterase class II)
MPVLEEAPAAEEAAKKVDVTLHGASDAAAKADDVYEDAESRSFYEQLPDLQAAVERATVRRLRTAERRAVDRLIREEVALRTVQLEQEKGALRAMTISVVETLINAMEAKDLYLRGHSLRVAEIAAALAVHLELDAATVASIHTAGRLHDVGKIGIRQEILNKPGPLTHEEYAHVKDHVRIGLEILSPLNHLGEALLYIRDHHEHWDGGGYPFGRAADDITIGGRILAAADAFDALTSKRAYREPLTAAATLEHLRTQAGRQFEPRIFEALHAVVQNGTVEGIPRVK